MGTFTRRPDGYRASEGKYLYLIVIPLLLFGFAGMKAQDINVCGDDSLVILENTGCCSLVPGYLRPCEEEMENTEAYPCLLSFKIRVVGIRDDNGQGPDEPYLKDVFAQLQENFAPYHIYFDLASIEYIDDTGLYEAFITSGLFANLLEPASNPGDRITIYVGEPFGLVTYGRAGGLPGRALVVTGNQLGSGTLAHEMGHCLGLFHTFRGWENVCINQDPDWVDPDPNSLLCIEGDGNLFLCEDCVPDTPSDPWIFPAGIDGAPLAEINQENCAVTENSPFQDVDVQNYMSYYLACRKRFTPGQIERIRKLLNYVEYNDENQLIHDFRYMQNTLSDKLIITADTGWDEPVEVCTDVYVEAPNTLTITSTASIHQGLKFVIKPGAQLRLEGGVMTDAGDGYWKGIEVWGDANATQIPNTGQGKLYIGGGAVIEHATEAIVAFNPNPPDGDVEATGGGLVLAFDSYFRNNARSVEYRRYDGQNFGRFVNCEFTIDGGHYGHPFREHVKLNGVRGLQFIDCTFSNDTGPGDVFLGKGAGIHSLDANFTVGGSGTVFQKLRFGVQAGAAKGAEGFMIRDATFRELEKGVLASAVSHFTVTRCTLEVGGHVSNLPPFLVSQEGVQINECTGFSVQDNDLKGESPDTPEQSDNVGIKVINTTRAGNDANVLYGNRFNDLYVGNAAVGENAGAPEGGVVYECNKNLGNNYFDFWVQEGIGVTEDQRSASGEAAGNSFSMDVIHEDGHFNNQGGLIEYFYDEEEPSEEPTQYTENNINLNTAETNECSNGETGGGIPGEDIGLVKSRFFDAKAQYQLYKADYDELIDDGDTPGLLAEVAQAGAGQAAGLINDLLGISPYVSQHVLKAVVDKPAVFDNGMQVDLLEANPEAVRKAGFWLYLEENSSLDGEELSQVQQASLLNTGRDVIEQDLSAAYAGMHRAADLVLAYYLLDSVAYNRDSALLWLDHKGSLHSFYLKADILFQTGQGEAAENTLSSIPEAFLLTDKQREEYDNKLALSQLLSGQADIFKLDSLEVAELSTIAEGEGLAGVQARNLLDYAYGIEQEPDHSLPSTTEERTPLGSVALRSPYASIRAFPNPAKETVTFEYAIPAGEEASVRLINTVGRTVAEISLSPRAGLKEWDISGLAEGVYWYQLWIDEKPGSVGKLAIQH